MAVRQIRVVLFLLLPFFCFADYPADTFADLYSFHLEKLPYLKEKHPPIAILFSATPGMGKTTISKHLSSHYHALLISTDELRLTMKNHGVYCDKRPVNENEKLLHQFFSYFLNRLFHEYPNQFYVMDASMDRKYETIKENLDSLDFRTILVRLEVPRDLTAQRLIAREQYPDYFLRHLDKWFSDYESFDLNHVDIFFDNSDSLNIDKLIDGINRIFYSEKKLFFLNNERNPTDNPSRPLYNEASLSACD